MCVREMRICGKSFSFSSLANVQKSNTYELKNTSALFTHKKSEKTMAYYYHWYYLHICLNVGWYSCFRLNPIFDPITSIIFLPAISIAEKVKYINVFFRQKSYWQHLVFLHFYSTWKPRCNFCNDIVLHFFIITSVFTGCNLTRWNSPIVIGLKEF